MTTTDAATAAGQRGHADARPSAFSATPSVPAATSSAPAHDAVLEPRTSRASRNTTSDEADAPRRYLGELREHGSAPYLHNPARSDSYYVVFRDQAGVDQAVWGVDLERAMRESGAGIGQQVVLENLGKRLVTVRVPVVDGEGRVIGEDDRDVYRNTWQVDAVQRHLDLEASAPQSAGNPPADDARGAGSPAAPAPEPSHPHHGTRRAEDDQTMHLAVLATAMREQGFGERSIARVQQRAERMLVAFARDGTPVPTPKVFDPKAPSGRDQRRRPAQARALAPEIERAPAGLSPMSPSR